MLRVQDIPLTEVFSRYAGIDDFTPDGRNRYKCLCPFHNDTSPSLILYDKSEAGMGWDYHCFACGAHGTAVSALVAMGKAQTESAAESTLRRDFEMVLPPNVTLEGLSALKGLSLEFMKKQGWRNCREGVEIPLLNANGDVHARKVRTLYEGKGQKFFFREDGFDTLPYGIHWLDTYENDIIYITEGETDTATMKQAGYPVVGIAGSLSFRSEFAAYFARFKSIVIVKDNDEAGWKLISAMAEYFPTNLYMAVLPKGCKDVNNLHVNRCNSQIGDFKDAFSKLPILPATPLSFIEAVKSEAVLPTDKVCWDMVVRCMADRAELLYFKEKFSKDTKTPKSLVNECIKSASAPSMETMRDNGEFLIIDGCYYKEVLRGNAMVQVRITNFIVEPQYDMYVDNEVTRVVNLVNSDGVTAYNIPFEADTLASPVKFNQRCLGAGNFIFTGEQPDLFCMCYTIFNVPKDTVYSPRMIGKVHPNRWLFHNCGVDSTGEVVKAYDGIVRLDGVAYKPRGICITDEDGDTGNSGDMPHIKLGVKFPEDYPSKLLHTFRDTFGTLGAWTALGWVVAGWHSDAIFNKFGFFPYLFVTGKRASGKSVFCTLLQSAFGFNPNQAGMSIESPTNVGIMRYLGYRSSLPQWYDDYRNGVRRIQMKDNLLLDAYNRHGSVKGTKEGGVNNEAVNGFLLLSGEDVPANNALLTRCCLVTLSEYERDASVFTEAKAFFEDLPSYCLKFAVESILGLPEALGDSIDNMKQTILDASGDIRDASNKSIFAGAFLYAFSQYLTEEEIEEYIQYICADSTEQVASTQAEHPMQLFFNDFCDLNLRQGDDYVVDNDHIYIRIPSCHYAWTQKHDKTAPLSKAVLTKYIKKEPYYVAEERHYFDLAGRQRCLDLDMSLMTDAQMDGFVSYISKCCSDPVF